VPGRDASMTFFAMAGFSECRISVSAGVFCVSSSAQTLTSARSVASRATPC
jgi:hypothetical protein